MIGRHSLNAQRGLAEFINILAALAITNGYDCIGSFNKHLLGAYRGPDGPLGAGIYSGIWPPSGPCSHPPKMVII